ncbi:hypothetical protein GGR53DRAFT_504094 [Hypoxylon sp. FL1150]|nr:hypothetical protein GGR53DRAFT_504094 [Hypoxylon sp. FL1150]
MPLPKVSRSLPKWPDPAQSIGRQIMSRRLGRRKAWWPRGPALEIFEKEIHPAIEAILKSVDLCYADILIRPYMIGRDPDRANPVVMICCTNSDTRNDAEVRIRSSGLLNKYAGFGLGAAALPLENSAPSRLLGSEHDNQSQNTPNERHEDALSCRLYDVPFYHPHLNPRVTTAGDGGELAEMNTDIPGRSPYATGGAIVDVAGECFQLTISHFTGTSTNHFEDALSDLEECHFDVSMDDSDSDDEVEPQQDLLFAATSRGSMSPVSSASQTNTSSGKTEELSFDVVESSSPSLHTLGVIRAGNLLLDYSIVRIPSHILRDNSNTVEYGHKLLVERVAQVGTEERAVVVVTSVGPLKGTLIPGGVSYRRRNQASCQTIFQVKLEVAAVEGDCGAAVLDEQTGDLYGHLFLGGTGSPVAYFIPAIHVLRDISNIMKRPVSIFGGQIYAAIPFSGQSGQSGAMRRTSATNEANPTPAILRGIGMHILGVGTLYGKESEWNEEPKSSGNVIEQDAIAPGEQPKKLEATVHEREFEKVFYPRKFRASSSFDDSSSTTSRSPVSVFSEPLSPRTYTESSTTTSASNSTLSTEATAHCLMCDKCFHGKHAKSHLSRHKRGAHRERDSQVQCPFCDKTFSHIRTDNIRVHCRNVHQQELPRDGKKFWAATSSKK